MQPPSRIEMLNRLLEEGVPFEQAVEKLKPSPPGQKEMLRRLAFLRSFDKPLFEFVATPWKSDSRWDYTSVLQTPGIESFGGETFRIKEGLAATLLLEWINLTSGLSQLRAFAKDTLSYHLQTSTGSEIERLRCLVAAGDPSALQKFNQDFEQANKDFDIARCHALVRMLKELDNYEAGGVEVPLRLLTPELQQRYEALLPYVAVRGRFVEEYLKSATYLERDALKQRALAFLATDQWLLPVYGAGGRGKTMFLHWFLSRFCIPEPNRIPVARVDCDEINLAKLEIMPALLLIPLAEQLNRQIASKPFGEFLDAWARFGLLLTPSARVSSTWNLEGLESEFRSLVNTTELAYNFAFKIRDVSRVVIMIDTLEEAMLHFPDALHGIIELFRNASLNARSLRLILSGRYNLSERGFLSAEAAPIEVTPFSHQESNLYLVGNRELHNEPIRNAIVHKANGNPFLLSLLADLYEDGSVRTADDVQSLKAEFAYLIERIIRRIPEKQSGVRWVIRYGVVPRRLTREFLTDVMQPHLRAELAAGQGNQDRLQQYDHYFPRGIEINVQAFWDDLGKYASDYGWLRASQDELRFQPEVVFPMRALLADEPIYTQLHRDAKQYFLRKATSDPQHWASWTAEAIFHDVLCGEPDAGDLFDKLLRDTRAGDPVVRRALIDAVAASGFLDDDGNPRVDNNRKWLADPDLLAFALLEAAKLGAAIGFTDGKFIETTTYIRHHLSGAVGLAGYPENRPDALVEMALALNAQNPRLVMAWAELIDPQQLEPPDRFSYRRLCAQALQVLAEDSQRAMQHANEAIRLVPVDHPLHATLMSDLRALTAKISARTTGDFTQLFGLPTPQQTNVPPVASQPPMASEYTRMFQTAAPDATSVESLLEAGQYSKVMEALPSFKPVYRSTAIDHLRNIRTWTLAQVAQRKSIPIPEEVTAPNPYYLEARGAARIAAGQLEGGLNDLQAAAVQYRQRGDLASLVPAQERYVDALIHRAGNWRKAKTESTSDVPAVAARLFVQRAWLATRLNEGMTLGPSAAPWMEPMAQLVMGASSETAADHLRSIAEAFSSMVVELRYRNARFFRGLLPIGASAPDDVLKVLPAPDDKHPDFLAHVFPYIHCLHYHGRKEQAEAMLQRAIQAASKQKHTAGLELIAAAQTLGTALPPREAFGDPPPELQFAISVRCIRLLLDRREEKEARKIEKNLPVSAPSQLAGTQIEALHLENSARLVAATNIDTARSFAARAADVFKNLGRDDVARAALASAGVETAPKAGVHFDSIIVSLANLPDPFPAPSATASLIPFECLKAMAEGEKHTIVPMLRSLPETLADRPKVRLVHDHGPLSMLPWEWVFEGKQICYRATRHEIPEGQLANLIWPRLPSAIRRLLGWVTRAVKVAILQPSVSTQIRKGRGYERTARRTLAAIYRAHGIPAFDDPLESILEVIDDRKPSVWHIQMPVAADYGQIYLDTDSTTQWTPSFLSGRLRDSYPLDPPLIILDPPRPPDDLEAARQLLLRNRFATELYASGHTRAILCTGLISPNRAELFAERFIHAMSSAPTMSQLLEVVRRENDDRFSSQGAALFVEHPERIMVK